MIKTLWKSLREYKKTSLLTIGLTLFEVVFEIVIPLCMAELIDRGVEQGEMNLVLKYGLALVVFALLQLMTGMGSALAAARSAAGFAANLRQDMYDNVQTFSFSNIDKFSTSSIVTRLTTDVTNVQNAYQMLIKLAMRGPFMILFAMVVSFRINRGISLVFLALIPVLGIGLILIVRTVHPIFQKVFENYDRLNNVVQENLRGVRVVKSFHQQSKEIEKFDRVSERIYQDFAKAERLISLNTPLLQFCLYLSMLLISWLGAKAIVASGNNADHRRPDGPVQLRHPDPDEPDDALHGVRHDDHCPVLCGAYLGAAAGDVGHSESEGSGPPGAGRKHLLSECGLCLCLQGGEEGH